MASSTKTTEPSLKKVKNTIIRNVLCAPKEDEWPVLPDDKVDVVKSELMKHFPSLQVPKAVRRKRKLKNQSKDEKSSGKELEESQLLTNKREVASNLRSYLFLGMNAVSRAIENGTVMCCLIAGDVAPSMLIKPLVQLAINSKIPVFLFKGLKKFCSDSIGFPCIAIGFRKCSPVNEEQNPFSEVCRLLIQFNVDIVNNRGNSKDAQDKTDSSPLISTPSTIKHQLTSDKVSLVETNESSSFLLSPSSYHLMRRSKYERTYTPESSSQCEEPVKTSPLDPSLPRKSNDKLRLKYSLPTVLRIRDNPFKLKRKKKKK